MQPSNFPNYKFPITEKESIRTKVKSTVMRSDTNCYAECVSSTFVPDTIRSLPGTYLITLSS